MLTDEHILEFCREIQFSEISMRGLRALSEAAYTAGFKDGVGAGKAEALRIMEKT